MARFIVWTGRYWKNEESIKQIWTYWHLLGTDALSRITMLVRDLNLTLDLEGEGGVPEGGVLTQIYTFWVLGRVWHVQVDYAAQPSFVLMEGATLVQTAENSLRCTLTLHADPACWPCIVGTIIKRPWWHQYWPWCKGESLKQKRFP